MTRTGIDDGLSQRLLRRFFALALGVAVSSFAVLSGLAGLVPVLIIGISGQLYLGRRFAQIEPIASWRWALWIGGPYSIPILILALGERDFLTALIAVAIILPSWIGAELGLRQPDRKEFDDRVQAAQARTKRVIELLRQSDEEADRLSADNLESLLESMEGRLATMEALFSISNLCRPLGDRELPGLTRAEWSRELDDLKDQCADAFNELERS